MLQKFFLIAMVGLFLSACQREKIIQDSSGIVKTKLKNGLTILIHENHSTPLVTLLTRVKTGYANEPLDQEGISHLIEHMSLKGTWKRPGPDEIPSQVRSLGAQIHSWTSFDDTSYSMTFQNRYFEQALELQMDSILNMKFDPTELSKETEVVIQEIKRKKDNPIVFGQDNTKKILFPKSRSYGTEEGLRKLTRNHLIQFFEHYYKPNNIVLTVSGNINAREVLKIIRRYYEPLLPKEVPSQPIFEEESFDFRFKRLSADIKNSYIFMYFPTVSILHEDIPTLEMISHILTLGKSSRLPQFIHSSLEKNSKNGYFSIQALVGQKNIFQTETLILSEIERLKHEPLKKKELNKIKNQLKTLYFLKEKNSFEFAKTISFFEVHQDYSLYRTYFQKLNSVTSEQIQLTAQKYLNLKKCSILEYVPQQNDSHTYSSQEILKKLQHQLSSIVLKYTKSSTLVETEDSSKENIMSVPVSAIPATPQTSSLKKFHLSNNATLLLKEDHSSSLIALSILFKGGRLYEYKSNSGITQLLLRASLKGTTTKKESNIAERLDELGAILNTVCELDYFGYHLTIPKENLDESLKVLSDIILHPSFTPSILEKEKDTLLLEIEREQDLPQIYSFSLFKEAAFKNHPYGLPNLGLKKSILSITSDKLIQWHAKQINSSDMVISAFGNFNSLDMRTYMENYFKVIEPRRQDIPSIEDIQLPSFISENFRERKKEQTAILIGFEAVPQNHTDYYPLKVMEYLATDVGGRFDVRLRSKEKLTHITMTSFRSYLKGGVFTTYTLTSPEDEKKVLRSLLEEYKKLRDDPIEKKELLMAQNTFATNLLFSLTSSQAEAEFYAVHEIYGKTFSTIQEFMNQINTITIDHLNDVAVKYFNLDNYTLGIVRGSHQIQSIISTPPKPIPTKPKIKKPPVPPTIPQTAPPSTPITPPTSPTP